MRETKKNFNNNEKKCIDIYKKHLTVYREKKKRKKTRTRFKERKRK
jgi:hypothetical protein